MTQINASTCRPRLCQNSSETQTPLSFCLKTFLVALGIIAIISGILILCDCPLVNYFKHESAWAAIGSGLFLILMGNAIKCVKSNLTKKEKIDNSKTQKEKSQLVFNPQSEAIVYMSMGGNPPHIGHLAAIGTAIKELKRRNIKVITGYVSLSPQSYLENKMKNTAGKVYSFIQRQEMLTKVIQLAKEKNMFGEVPVTFWNDQENGDSDHPDSYRVLEHQFPNKKIFLVAGSDLCFRMANWPSIAHAIVITRGEGDPETLVKKNEQNEISCLSLRSNPNHPFVVADNKSRILAVNAFPQYENYSSTKIRRGEILIDYLP